MISHMYKEGDMHLYMCCIAVGMSRVLHAGQGTTAMEDSLYEVRREGGRCGTLYLSQLLLMCNLDWGGGGGVLPTRFIWYLAENVYPQTTPLL